MKVAIITATQAQQLKTKTFNGSTYFNPVQDAAGNWVITAEEITACTNDEVPWVKDLVANVDFDKPAFTLPT